MKMTLRQVEPKSNSSKHGRTNLVRGRGICFFSAAFLLVCSSGHAQFGSWNPVQDVSNAVQNTVNTVAKAADDTVKTAKKAADDTGDTLNKAADDTTKTVKKAADDTGNAVNKATDDAINTVKKAADDTGNTLNKAGQDIENQTRRSYQDFIDQANRDGSNISNQFNRDLQNVGDAGTALGNHVYRDLKGFETAWNDAVARAQQGKFIDGVWYLGIDPLRNEEKNAALTVQESSLLRTVAQVGASAYGGPGGRLRLQLGTHIVKPVTRTLH